MLRRGQQKPASSDKGNSESVTAMTTPSNNNQLNALTAEIEQRTGGKFLGEMTNEELWSAFADGPVHFRGGEVVNE